jgi:hypothetical protein
MNIARLEDKLIIVSQEVGTSVYDFDFDLHFTCSHPYIFESEERCVLRIGPIVNYAAEYDEKRNMNLRLINSPAEHARASELEVWYPLIKELTPRTMVFDALPTAEEIEANFAWPVFLKGSRQTSKHNPELSVIPDRMHYKSVAERYLNDPILHWQKPVVREFIPLVPVTGQVPGKVRPSLEYRSFWWHGECVGWDRYWYQIPPYESLDVADGFAVANQVAKRLNVPFLVVDVAKTLAGHWIAIECNDAQESGYASIPPYELWRKILALVVW